MKNNLGITKSRKVEWNFGEKHKEYIRACKDNTINVAEGAVRAGKTIDNVFAFAMELEHTPDKIHLATGSTVGNAKLNIGESNGFGLEHIFRGRSRWGLFKGNECLYVNSVTGIKVIIFVGGAKADSYKSFRGNSYGMWIATEINLHHEDTIKEAFNRQLMAINRKIFWDLNPSRPTHFIYENYIDKYSEQEEKGEFVGGFNHERFSIFDNINLTAQRIKEIISQYVKGTVWYERDILGRRMVAEGLIYKLFADNYNDYLLEEPKEYMQINIGVDYGGNDSYHTFVATGITKSYREVVALSSVRIKARITPTQLDKKFVEFVKTVIDRHGFVDYVYCDSSDKTLTRGFKTITQREGLPIRIRDARKIKIIDRIRLVNILIAQSRFYYTNTSKTVEEALKGAVWELNTEEDRRLDDGTSDIDTLDAFEYSIERDLKRLVEYVKPLEKTTKVGG